MKEEWRRLGFWWDYKVSNFGRVIGPKGILKPTIKKQTKYLVVMLHGEAGRKQEGVHRLVLEAFVGSCPKGMMACHNNGNPQDNRLENLRWDTAKANMEDRTKHGRGGEGERNGMAKLTEDQVRYIRSCTEKQQALADRFGVSQVKISQIRLNKCWRHVV